MGLDTRTKKKSDEQIVKEAYKNIKDSLNYQGHIGLKKRGSQNMNLEILSNLYILKSYGACDKIKELGIYALNNGLGQISTNFLTYHKNNC